MKGHLHFWGTDFSDSIFVDHVFRVGPYYQNSFSPHLLAFLLASVLAVSYVSWPVVPLR